MSSDQPNSASEEGAPAPRCSIVVPAYNVENYLQHTIDSVLSQSFDDWELIIVDDGSTDETFAVADSNQDSRIRLFRQANGGPSAARNHGLREARGEFVLFLDSDDQLYEDSVERFLKVLSAENDLVAAYGEASTIDEHGQFIAPASRPVFNQRPSGEVLATLVVQNFVTSPGVLCARASFVRSQNGFREDLSVSEDWELWCRLATQGSFAYLGDDPVLAYRRRAGSVLRSSGLEPSNALRCVDAVFSNPEIAAKLGRSHRKLKRFSMASAYSLPANQHIRDKNWARAAQALVMSIRHDPFRTRTWILLLFAILRWMPKSISTRLK